MDRFFSRGARSIAVALALLFALVLTQRPAFAAGTVSTTPTSGPPGTNLQVTGAGFTIGQPVSIYFASSYEGTVTVDASSGFSISFLVPNFTSGTYTISAVSASGTATTTFAITGSSVTGITLSKAVTVNGLGYSTSASAFPNDQLTYRIIFQNKTGSPMTGVTVTDHLSAGQVAFTSPSQCSFDSPSNTVTCTAPGAGSPVAAGGQVTFYFTTVIVNGFVGTITNAAQGYANGVAAATSNSTSVTVGTVVTYSSPIQLCGPVTAYAPPGYAAPPGGSVTVSGVTVPLQSGATVSGSAIVYGANECLGIVTNGIGAVSVTVTPNLSGISVICGTYGSFISGSTINVGGIPVVLFPGSAIQALAVPGTYYCFLLSPSGQAVTVLTGIPTSITFPHGRFALNHSLEESL
jgi:uncharacterized repeat protein (TIGR01451 family)